MKDVYIHLISDATGATLQGMAAAAMSQYKDVTMVERLWPLVRTQKQLERALHDIELHQGPVLFTLFNDELSEKLREFCAARKLPCIPVMDPILEGLSAYFGQKPRNVPGLQHILDDLYFKRIDALDFAMGFDDGQNYEGLETADVILVGVSRTSKTPTCIYLARQGIRAANIPLVPEVSIPSHILALKQPLFVGLTESPDRLIQLRASRLKVDRRQENLFNNSYIDPEKVEEEVKDARKFFREQGWPIIDVTKRSVEETSAEIMFLLQRRRESLETI